MGATDAAPGWPGHGRGQERTPPPRLCLVAPSPPTGEPAQADPSPSTRVLITGEEGMLGEPEVLQDDLPSLHSSETPTANSAKELPMSHEVNFYTY